MFKPLLSRLSGAGPRARLSILVYHRVLEAPDPMRPAAPTARDFRWQMELAARLFRLLPLGEAVDRLYAGELPSRALCITFDDGYADNYEVALPIAESLGLPLCFFVAAGFLDGGRMWNDTVIECFRRCEHPEAELRSLGIENGIPRASEAERRRVAAELAIRRLKHLPAERRAEQVDALASRLGHPLPRDLMMTSDQVRDLAARGMEIGGHTLSHPILALLDAPAARREIAAGKERLEAITGSPVDCFAYPNGKSGQDFTKRDSNLVAELGFKAAVTTERGISSASTSRYELRRFTPWDRTPARFAARLGLNYRSRPGRGPHQK